MTDSFFFNRRKGEDRRKSDDRRNNPRLDLTVHRRRKSDERRLHEDITNDFYAVTEKGKPSRQNPH
ncbi:hypothetical protein OAV62_01490 [bacterium]|nr:hypothetical protein [bacterium]